MDEEKEVIEEGINVDGKEENKEEENENNNKDPSLADDDFTMESKDHINNSLSNDEEKNPIKKMFEWFEFIKWMEK